MPSHQDQSAPEPPSFGSIKSESMGAACAHLLDGVGQQHHELRQEAGGVGPREADEQRHAAQDRDA